MGWKFWEQWVRTKHFTQGMDNHTPSLPVQEDPQGYAEGTLDFYTVAQKHPTGCYLTDNSGNERIWNLLLKPRSSIGKTKGDVLKGICRGKMSPCLDMWSTKPIWNQFGKTHQDLNKLCCCVNYTVTHKMFLYKDLFRRDRTFQLKKKLVLLQWDHRRFYKHINKKINT